MNELILNSKYTKLQQNDIKTLENEAKKAYNTLHTKSGKGNDFLGWLDYAQNLTSKEYQELEKVAQEIRKNASVLLVIGIGGSYLGSKAVIDAINGEFGNEKAKKNSKTRVIFAGQNISASYLEDLLELLQDESVYVCVISKSGTTTESAIAFRFAREFIESKYSKEEATKRIVAITDREKGALRTLSTKEGYRTFSLPEDIGGRFSVITPVGLLPILAAGINASKILDGFRAASKKYLESSDLETNEALKYAVIRNVFYKKLNKSVEVLVSYEPRLVSFAGWWKQLFAESEGKDGKGLYTSSLQFTTDLHSVGQFVQEGSKILFETVIKIKKPLSKLTLKSEQENLDGLNYLAGKEIEWVNSVALEATTLAHVSGGTPNLWIELDSLDEYNLGYLIAFFMHAVAYSGYMIDVNPFNQPGVEAYKKNMFALLGKPGYEDYKKEIEKLQNEFN